MQHPTRKRSRRTREEWQALIASFEKCDNDLEGFCHQAGISLDRFKIWQQRFSQASFIELPYDKNPTVDDSKPWDVELSLANDIVLRIRTR